MTMKIELLELLAWPFFIYGMKEEMLKKQNYKNYHLLVSISFILSILLFLYGCKIKDDSENGDNTLPTSERWLYTKGNKIYTHDGQVWQGRGANLQDTRGCNACTWSPPNTAEIKRRIDELVDVWGADFIRLTMESYAASQGRTHWQGILLDREYLDDIIEIVDYIKSQKG